MAEDVQTGFSTYTGPAGRTRTERVRVFRPGREPLEVEVFRAVNVDEYPELRNDALGGTLHQLDDGEVIDVPFIYHDPAAQQFVLVIPYGARGRELSERARLLDFLMKEHDEDVPDYVRHFAIVYGRHGLQRYIDEVETMEVDVAELEPLDALPLVPSHYPRLASLLPPAAFWSRASSELAPLIDEDELWLFVRVEADEQEAFTEASSDLLIQLKTVDQLPVCILTLIDGRTRSIRRAFLNPSRSADRRILELLGRDFQAIAVVHTEDGVLLRSFRVEAPRAANTKMIIGRTERAPQPLPGRWEEAADACRLNPPPIGLGEHPYVLEDEATSAVEALRRLERLEAWNSPEKIEEALMRSSVPRTVFELSRRRTVADAVRFGLAMSNEVLLQAVRFGLATSASDLVAALGRNFEEIVASGSAQGLGAERIKSNREALAGLSRLHGTSTLPELSCTIEHSG